VAFILSRRHGKRGGWQEPTTPPELVAYYRPMPDLVFEVVQDGDGGYCAECLTDNIFTEGDT
jgi:hypothetical protein